MIGDAISIRAWIVLILNIVCSEMITMRISMLMLSKLLHFSNGFKLFSMARCTLIGTRQKKSLFSKQASPKSWKNPRDAQRAVPSAEVALDNLLYCCVFCKEEVYTGQLKSAGLGA